MYLADVYTVPVNLAGIPALSIPAGFSDGLPVGLQILGKHFSDDFILQVGEWFESNYIGTNEPKNART
jgi:aspartyl-tRNA(Asn)/glutamyl-tRNA(Gln) amidotransferase subunit A